eukprot:2220517-Rhodomonas_salina.4
MCIIGIGRDTEASDEFRHALSIEKTRKSVEQFYCPSSKISSSARMSSVTLDIVDFGVVLSLDCSLLHTTANAAKICFRRSDIKEYGRRKRWHQDKTNQQTQANSSPEKIVG